VRSCFVELRAVAHIKRSGYHRDMFHDRMGVRGNFKSGRKFEAHGEQARFFWIAIQDGHFGASG
jgi:hypothetical protein